VYPYPPPQAANTTHYGRSPQVSETGVIYLSRIPHGFYEDQMRAYFSQFGEISRLRLSRNKRVRLLLSRTASPLSRPVCAEIELQLKTGKSKHYGFIEFVSAPVAHIVAETMDNYLLMGHIMTCKIIPKDEVHPELWVGANRRWRVVPTYRLAQARHNKVRPSVSRLNCDFPDISLTASKREATTRCRKAFDEQTRGAEKEACRGGDCVRL
jgi:nucleolar protein 15